MISETDSTHPLWDSFVEYTEKEGIFLTEEMYYGIPWKAFKAGADAVTPHICNYVEGE